MHSLKSAIAEGEGTLLCELLQCTICRGTYKPPSSFPFPNIECRNSKMDNILIFDDTQDIPEVAQIDIHNGVNEWYWCI